ncbi:beige/beach-related [Anaeramoeba ignava]|uniref:Beige/beach-related n=1 Tax=Anaeramoeba ignava TaxID=1746090 RepID=A0A9Q0LNQ4_ANAIG|nr:beige/beach-related [Anaeramoeba ignava]
MYCIAFVLEILFSSKENAIEKRENHENTDIEIDLDQQEKQAKLVCLLEFIRTIFDTHYLTISSMFKQEENKKKFKIQKYKFQLLKIPINQILDVLQGDEWSGFVSEIFEAKKVLDTKIKVSVMQFEDAMLMEMRIQSPIISQEKDEIATHKTRFKEEIKKTIEFQMKKNLEQNILRKKKRIVSQLKSAIQWKKLSRKLNHQQAHWSKLKSVFRDSDFRSQTKKEEKNEEKDLFQLYLDFNDFTIIPSIDNLNRFSDFRDLVNPKNILFSEPCFIRDFMKNIPGVFQIKSEKICFFIETTKNWELDLKNPKKIKKQWGINSIAKIRQMKFNFQPTAIEILFLNRKSYFFNFPTKEIANSAFENLKNLNLINLTEEEWNLGNFQQLTTKWQNFEVSNFEYLMRLNYLAGRTFNDLSQYPVFPWILSNYESKSINLSDPKNYRDLSKPIGALNSDRLEKVVKRFNDMSTKDALFPPFHYGSLYSSSGIALYYLVRLEPFTKMSYELHNQTFDHPDRIFFSINSAWKSVLTNFSDIRELIPEFFYFPEFLENREKIDFGKQFTGDTISEVILPLWSRNSDTFIQKHMQAFESEHVSSNFHNWIDLIFGYKQRGKQAKNAHNVFFHLSYEKNNDLSSQEEKETINKHVENFGQIPRQLFTDPHPAKKIIKESPLISKISPKNILDNIVICQLQISEHPISHLLLLHTSKDSVPDTSFDKLISIDSRKHLRNHKWNIHKFDFETISLQKSPKKFGSEFFELGFFHSSLYSVNSNSLIFSCGYSDFSFRVHSSEFLGFLGAFIKHKDIVTCIACTDTIFVTGSRDTTVVVWDILSSKKPIQIQQRYQLTDHKYEVNCVAINQEYDMLVTGSEGGSVLIYSLNSGRFFCSLDLKNLNEKTSKILQVRINNNGGIIVFSSNIISSIFSTSYTFSFYSINARFLGSISFGYPITSWDVSFNNLYLVVGCENEKMEIFDLQNYKRVKSFKITSRCSSVCITNDGKYLLVGCENGMLLFIQSDV